MTSSEKTDDIDWRSEYFNLFADYNDLVNKFVNQSKRINSLLQIIAQHESYESSNKGAVNGIADR